MEATGEHQMSVVLSSHLVADLERACDYLIVLAAGRVQAGLEDMVLAYMSQAAGPAGPAQQLEGSR